MKLHDLISIIECGTKICVYDGSTDNVVFNGCINHKTIQLLYNYHNYTIVSINTDSMINGVSFEIVINNVL